MVEASGLRVWAETRCYCYSLNGCKAGSCERIETNYFIWKTRCWFLFLRTTSSKWCFIFENFFPKITRWFVTISDTAAKNYKDKINETNLFVRKMTVSDIFVGAIEKTVLKTPAMYRYNRVITETFLATWGQLSWKHEDIFYRRTNKATNCCIVLALELTISIPTTQKIWFAWNYGLSKRVRNSRHFKVSEW